MNILIITLSLSEKNGLGRFSVGVIKELSKYCDRVDVLVSRGDKISNVPTKGCNVYQVIPNMFELMNPLVCFYHALKIRSFFKRTDIAHSLMDYPHAVLCALGASMTKKPFVLTGVGTYSVAPLSHPIQGKLLRYAYRNANKVICISKFTEQEILKRIRLNNTTIVNPGVSSRFFRQREVKKEKKSGDRILLSVGAIKARKGYDVSIKAFAEVKKIFPDVKYYIAGSTSGTYYDFLRNLTEELGVSEEVRFLGKVSDEELVKLYHLADIFVLTSKNVDDMFEGFGLVYLEANACGRPAIGTLGCGAEDAIIDGYNGFLVPQDDPKSTAEAILNLLGNTQALRQMGENARQRAKEMSWKNAVEQILEVYQEITKEK